MRASSLNDSSTPIVSRRRMTITRLINGRRIPRTDRSAGRCRYNCLHWRINSRINGALFRRQCVAHRDPTTGTFM